MCVCVFMSLFGHGHMSILLERIRARAFALAGCDLPTHFFLLRNYCLFERLCEIRLFDERVQLSTFRASRKPASFSFMRLENR